MEEVVRNDWNEECLTPMRILQSIPRTGVRDGTVVSFPLQPSSPFLLTERYAPPTCSQCVSKYDSFRLELVPPFRCTVKGIIVDVQVTYMGHRQTPHRVFDIVDDVGCWMRCCAVGRNAKATAIVACNIVVLYFCTGRPSMGSSKGMLYLWDDALGVKIGHQTRPIVKRQEIPIG